MRDQHQIKSTPKDVFLYLLSIAALYTSTVNLVTLLFGYIDIYFPDVLNLFYEYRLGSLRWAIASLIILFPVYLFTSWLINLDIKAEPQKREIKIRRWLIYLTLFIAALVIIGDLVTLIYNFLEGDLTARFILKILTVFALAGSIFGYYFWELRQKSDSNLRKKIAMIAGAAAVAVVVFGFFVAGSPFEQRLKKGDEQRVSDLQTIQYQILNYWQNKGKLPTALPDLRDSISGFREPVDPETIAPYTYNAKGALSFELCAEFKTASLSTGASPKAVPAAPYYTGGELQNNWEHGIGNVCFDRTIDPQLYGNRKF